MNILTNLLCNRKQRIILNGQVSTSTSVNAGFPPGSILGPLLFIIYTNELSNNLWSNDKLFADGTSLFSVIHDINVSAGEFNEDLKKKWAFQWKMIFNLDTSKQAQEVIFSGKIKKPTHSPLVFNNAIMPQTNSRKHLGDTLDLKLTF